MSDPRTDLLNVLVRLEAVYDVARMQIQEDNDKWGNPLLPEQMQDSNGRYILLDALTAIVNARTALLNGVKP